MSQHYLFYFSYAPADASPYLQKFYTDLSSAVQSLTPFSSDKPVGFFDLSSITLGQEWYRGFVEALGTSNVLICILSRAYLNSEFAGKEFQVFQNRLESYVGQLAAQGERQHPSLIFPVFWEPPVRLPALPQSLLKLQFSPSDFEDSYAIEGLYYIMRLSSFRTNYVKFLANFAKQVVRAAYSDPLPALTSLPSLREVKSAFQETSISSVEAPVWSRATGPDVVQFLFVAGRRTEMKAIRNRLDFYGEHESEWIPFLPEDTSQIALIAQRCAISENYVSSVLPFRKDLLKELRWLEKQNTVIIIIVDVWSLNLEQYAEAMREYDALNFINSAVLILWNEYDSETIQNHAMLEDIVKITFIRKFLADTGYLRDGIISPEMLSSETSIMLNKVRRRIFERAKLFRNISLMSTLPKPKIIS
jgi:FxsC-like protein